MALQIETDRNKDIDRDKENDRQTGHAGYTNAMLHAVDIPYKIYILFVICG